MKILIVTVYNSHNSGSYLQAYAMMIALKKMGHEVRFMEREIRGSSHDKKKVVKGVLTKTRNLHLGQAYYSMREWFVYEKEQKRLSIVPRKSTYYDEADCILLGSDTIWNFDSLLFSQYASTYLGSDFAGKHIISYAASAANTSLEQFENVVNKYGRLLNISTIMVRDKHTKELVEHTTNRAAVLVTDPTLLLSKEDYECHVIRLKTKRPYVLLYYFGNMPEPLKESIVSYANANGLDLVSMPSYRPWCNKSYISSPQNMVSLFMEATAIVTNTFHGTAFSLIFEKPFADHDVGKNKVKELLIRYGEESRLFTDPKDIAFLLTKQNNVVSSGLYETVRLESLRELKEALEK